MGSCFSVSGIGIWVGTPYVAQVEEKDEALDASRLHGAQKDERARDIVHIVLERILDGFSHVDVGGEVDHGIKIACHQERIHHGSIAQVPFDQLHFRIHDGSDMSIYHVV